MSKAKLRKELETFSEEQLREIILNAYSASSEAKEYFEFFLNPDVNALYDKKSDQIAKELNRMRYGYSKARISHIRKIIKDFAAYGVGCEPHANLIFVTLRWMLRQSVAVKYSETLLRGIETFASEYLDICYQAGYLDTAVANLNQLLEVSGLPSTKRKIKAAMEETLTLLSKKIN